MSINVCISKCSSPFALAVLTICSAGVSAAPPDSITLPITPHYQLTPQLCWAATSQMAVEYLINQTSADSRVSQLLLGAYKEVEIFEDQLQPGISNQQRSDLTDRLESCKTDCSPCSTLGDPILVGLNHNAASFHKLTKKEIKEEIGTRGRPFIFSWNFKGNGNALSGNYHYLMAVGYDATDSSNFKLIIWDPWPGDPDNNFVVPPTAPTKNDFRSIPYKTYKNPTLDDSGFYSTYLQTWSGFEPITNHTAIPPDPVDFAVSQLPASCSNLAIPIAANPIVGTGGILQPAIPSVNFEVALTKSLPVAERARKLKERSGWLPPGSEIGMPFPIVSWSLDDLRNPDRALGLLRAHQTYIVLYPVTAGEKIVDSFLVVNGFWGWKERGYANNEISRRLVDIRARQISERHLRPEEIYYLSIPQLRAFFVAFELNGRTKLVSTTTDPSIGIGQNRELFADEALARIARSIGRVDH
jgi:hypothetical protein